MKFLLNGKTVRIPAPMGDDPLLWLLRDHFGLTGPKFGCGEGLCGACTVIVDGDALRSCVTAAAEVAGRRVTTLEGLAQDGRPHPVQAAWIAESVPQCGYCQNGQIMTAAALLDANPAATDNRIADAMDGVLCRCGTQTRIRKAIRRAQKAMAGDGS